MSLELTSYLLGKKAGGGGTINNQNKTITENGSYTADAGYTGLGVVTVDVETPAPNLQNKNVTITENTTTNISADSGYDGLGQVSVTTDVAGDVSEYFDDTIGFDNSSFGAGANTGLAKIILKLPKIKHMESNTLARAFAYYQGEEIDISELENTSKVTVSNGFSSMFQGCENLKTIKGLQNINITNNTSFKNLGAMFAECKSLETIPLFDTTNVDTMQNIFSNCHSLKSIPQFNTTNVTNMSSAFRYCYKLETIPQLDTSNVTSMSNMFANCYSLKSIPQLDTSNVTSMSNMFNIGNGGGVGYPSVLLEEIPELDASKVNNITYIFNSSSPYMNAFTTFGGLKNLGEAYLTTQSANYNQYQLNLAYCCGNSISAPNGGLTHDSLMNVINKLYDIATKGCNTQRLVLGTNGLQRLTAEEIAIATNKGWTVS